MARKMSTSKYGSVDFGAGLDRSLDRAVRSFVKDMVDESAKATLMANGGWTTEAASVRGRSLARLHYRRR